MPDNNGGGSDGSSSSGDSSGGDGDGGGGGGSDSSSDDGGNTGIDGFILTLGLESDEIVLSGRNAAKLFGVNPQTRSHIICVLPQENDPEIGHAGKNFDVILLGDGSSMLGDVEGSAIEEPAWSYRIVDKPGQEEEGRPSWQEEALRQIYVRNAMTATFENQSGRVSVLFTV